MRNKYFDHVKIVASKDPMVQLAKKQLEDLKKEQEEATPFRKTKEMQLALKEEKDKLKIVTEKTKLQIRKQRVQLFLEEFMRCGNATQAVKNIFGVQSHASAVAIGGKLMKEARYFGRGILENRGLAYGDLIDHAIEKMKLSKDTDWWDRLMKIADYENFTRQQGNTMPNIVNIVGNTKNLADEFGFSGVTEGEVVQDKKPSEDESSEEDF